MIRIKDFLPFIEGWEAVLDKVTNITVTRQPKQIISPSQERGWILGAVAAYNNKYITLEIQAGQQKLSFNVEDLYILGYRNPLKPSRKPYVLRYVEDSPGSETGFFVVDFDPIDWEPYYGQYAVYVQLPAVRELPDGTKVAPVNETGTLYFFGLLRIRIKNEDKFFESLSKVFWGIITGKRLELASLKEVERLQKFMEELSRLRW